MENRDFTGSPKALNDGKLQKNQSNSVFEKLPKSLKRLPCPLKCFACEGVISHQILCALGRVYHSECFVCHKCSRRLEGTMFGVDEEDRFLCRDDYIKTYSPVCGLCNSVIVPTETGETVRVVALGREFHIDCYKCQDCGTHLTDELDKRCYPLDDLLLCYFCHRDRKKPHRKVVGSTGHGFSNPNLEKLKKKSNGADENGNYLLNPTVI